MTAPRVQIIPSSAFATCPTFNISPSHWSHYWLDARCNHGRLCGYADDEGGPCILEVDDHPARRGLPVHDDGKRWTKGTWRR